MTAREAPPASAASASNLAVDVNAIPTLAPLHIPVVIHHTSMKSTGGREDDFNVRGSDVVPGVARGRGGAAARAVEVEVVDRAKFLNREGVLRRGLHQRGRAVIFPYPIRDHVKQNIIDHNTIFPRPTLDHDL